MEGVERYLARVPRGVVLACALVGVIAVGVVDSISPSYLSFSLFYLLPVAVVAWACGRRPGIAIAVLACCIGATADVFFSDPVLRVAPLWNAVARFGIFWIVVVVLVQLHEALDREKRLARTDALTGAANPRWFMEVTENELARARRYGHPLTLAYVDVDDFKKSNDEFGHGAGDQILTMVAQTIRSSVRSSDVVARLGGDEFAVLMAETDADSAAVAFTRIRLMLLDAIQKQGWSVTVSVGIAEADLSRGSAALIAAADDLMYEAKRAGKDRIAWDATISLAVSGA
jgi:diguanylate cyclase (GGDEF)-like protein